MLQRKEGGWVRGGGGNDNFYNNIFTKKPKLTIVRLSLCVAEGKVDVGDGAPKRQYCQKHHKPYWPRDFEGAGHCWALELNVMGWNIR